MTNKRILILIFMFGVCGVSIDLSAIYVLEINSMGYFDNIWLLYGAEWGMFASFLSQLLITISFQKKKTLVSIISKYNILVFIFLWFTFYAIMASGVLTPNARSLSLEGNYDKLKEIENCLYDAKIKFHSDYSPENGIKIHFNGKNLPKIKETLEGVAKVKVD